MSSGRMPLYLVRHGEAKSTGTGLEPSLTKRGMLEVEWIARWAQAQSVRPVQIRHSGKRRAKETAEILARHLRPIRGFIETVGLSPSDDVTSTARLVNQEEEPLMLVGHLPFMGRLSSLLLLDDPESETVLFLTGSMACLRRDRSRWTLDWIRHPSGVD